MIRLETPSLAIRDEFLEAVARSRSLHGAWVTPPATPSEFERYLARLEDRSAHFSYLIRTDSGGLAGVVNVSEVVRGAFCSGYLGYYAFVPHDGTGCMKRGLTHVVSECFGKEELHRVEANIQPGNTASRGLVERLGFRLEGLSPRYLKIAGTWRDHERWAMTSEEWEASGTGPA
jgi:ribosomal-protein-alanine N-acetyltransferase